MSNITKTAEKVCKLIENNMALANKLAFNKKRTLPPRITFEELQSAAFLGLVEAANRFEPEKGFSFTTYAYPRISGAINDYLRELGLMNVSLEGDDDLCLKDTIVFRDTKDEIFDFVEESLGKQASHMLRSYYIDRFSLKEIGEQYGVSEGRVSQLISGYKRIIRDKWATFDLAA